MYWSLAMFGLYIYYVQNFLDEGGKQPKHEAMIGGSESSLKANLHFNLVPVNDILLESHERTSNVQACGLRVGEFKIWLSFNPDRPYFVNHKISDKKKEADLRVFLLGIKGGSARFKIERGITLNKRFSKEAAEEVVLSRSASYEFTYNSCKYRLKYLDLTTEISGVNLLFKRRYIAKYSLTKI
jgi:hypothetical protein